MIRFLLVLLLFAAMGLVIYQVTAWAIDARKYRDLARRVRRVETALDREDASRFTTSDRRDLAATLRHELDRPLEDYE